MFLVFSHPRDDDKDSQMIHINMITDRNETKDPNEEITFQVVKESG